MFPNPGIRKSGNPVLPEVLTLTLTRRQALFERQQDLIQTRRKSKERQELQKEIDAMEAKLDKERARLTPTKAQEGYDPSLAESPLAHSAFPPPAPLTGEARAAARNHHGGLKSDYTVAGEPALLPTVGAHGSVLQAALSPGPPAPPEAEPLSVPSYAEERAAALDHTVELQRLEIEAKRENQREKERAAMPVPPQTSEGAGEESALREHVDALQARAAEVEAKLHARRQKDALRAQEKARRKLAGKTEGSAIGSE